MKKIYFKNLKEMTEDELKKIEYFELEEVDKKILYAFFFDKYKLDYPHKINEFYGDFDPQLSIDKRLSYCNLSGIDFDGKSFDKVAVSFVDFSSAKNVELDPQKVQDKNLSGCNFGGIDFKGKSFKNAKILAANFKKAKNVNINPEEIYERNLRDCIFYGVDFLGKTFNDADVRGTSFIGAKNVNINPQTVYSKSLDYTKFYEIDFAGKKFDGISLIGTEFIKTENVNLEGNKYAALAKILDEYESLNEELDYIEKFIKWLKLQIEQKKKKI